MNPFLAILFLTSSALAATPCEPVRSSLPPQSQLKDLFESVCEVKFQADSCAQYWEKQLAHLPTPEEKRDWVKKLGSCSKGDRGFVEQLGVSSLSCLKGLKDGAVDLVTGIPKAIYSSFKSGLDCIRDVEGKRQRLEAFNGFLDPSERLKLDDYTVRTFTCPEFDQRLRQHTRDIHNKRMEEYIRTKNKSVFDRPAPKIPPQGDQTPSFWAQARQALDELGIKQECYTPEAQSEMYCEMISVIAGTVLSGGAGAARLGASSKLARVTGKSPEELERLAKELRSMTHEERVARAAANGGLSNAERVARSEQALGRGLTQKEKDALLRAHEVGKDAGYGTYTPAQIAEKQRQLAEAGFNEAERRILIYEGLAGKVATGRTPVELATGAVKYELEAAKMSHATGITRGVANDAAAQSRWLQAAQAREKELHVTLPDRVTQQQLRDAVRRNEDYILDPSKTFSRVDQRDAYLRYETMMGRNQMNFEDAARAYLRAGKPQEAAKVLERSPVVSNLSTDFGRNNYIQRFVKENSQTHAPAR